MKELSARKMREMNEITMTKNDEEAELQPVLVNEKDK